MNTLSERLVKAFKTDPTIAAIKEDVATHQGVPLERMEELGLSKADLKKLERQGLAIRAKTPNGSLMQVEDKWYKRFGPGSKNRWIIFIPDGE